MMDIASMTGFARLDGASGEMRWTWEIKSVNGRGLETRFRLTPGFDFIEPELRKRLAERFARGSFSAGLALCNEAGEAAIAVNRAALDRVIRLVEEISLRIDCERPQAEGILAVRGVLDQQSQENPEARDELAAALISSFGEACARLAKSRREEGAALAALVEGQLTAVEGIVAAARACAGASPEAIKDRIAAQLAELISGAFPEERIAQEAAMIALRADVREELDRTEAHVAAGRGLLAEGGAVGRRLDFIAQEFNREANTLCAKAQDMGLKRIGLDLKAVVDQMREQIQNIE